MSERTTADSQASAVPAGFAEAVRRALSEKHSRIVFLHWHGNDYVIKRVESKPRARLKQLFLMGLCRLAFPGHARAGGLRPGDGRWESARVQALSAAGVNVPRVELELPEAVVYQHCGMNFRRYLRQITAADRPPAIQRALVDLAGFHQGGHWHGGAQFRNLVVHQQTPEEGEAERFCRIDFEEDLGGRFSLPLLQVYDLALFLSDALALGDPAGKNPAFGQGLVESYRQIHWSRDHAWVLSRVATLARPILWLGPLLQRFGNAESRRVLVLARLLVATAHAGAPSTGMTAP